jgi:hypothetical protein
MAIPIPAVQVFAVEKGFETGFIGFGIHQSQTTIPVAANGRRCLTE